MPIKNTLKISIVYDNHSWKNDLSPDWGFSCLVKSPDLSVLFDTGAKGKILLFNMAKIGIYPKDIDVVVLSHLHGDHTGGLEALLEKNPKIEVWAPDFFPEDFTKTVKQSGATLRSTNQFQEIRKNVYTTGTIPGWIEEQSLLLDSMQGIIVITGCAHPRIVKILAKTKELMDKDIYMAMGGFHLAGFAPNEIKDIIASFKDMGVKKVAPCHCTGSEAIKSFKKTYTQNFIDVGVGREIILP